MENVIKRSAIAFSYGRPEPPDFYSGQCYLYLYGLGGNTDSSVGVLSPMELFSSSYLDSLKMKCGLNSTSA